MPQVLHTGKALRVCGPIAAQAVSVVTGAHSREPEACLKTRPGSRSRQLFENMETFPASMLVQPATPGICMTPRAEEPIFICPASCYDHTRRSLTGARIETANSTWQSGSAARSLPNGSADRNHEGPIGVRVDKGRSLTGTRIETSPALVNGKRCAAHTRPVSFEQLRSHAGAAEHEAPFPKFKSRGIVRQQPSLLGTPLLSTQGSHRQVDAH